MGYCLPKDQNSKDYPTEAMKPATAMAMDPAKDLSIL